jgi:segregation and condensation protein B
MTFSKPTETAAVEAAESSPGSAPPPEPEPSDAAGATAAGSELGIHIDNPEAAPGRPSAELRAIVEALIFASPEPLALKALSRLLDPETADAIRDAIEALEHEYQEQGRGLQVVEVAGGYQIVTRPELHEWVRRLFHERTTQKLSVQALETLAVIAYKQPITAAEITEIRGVNTSGVLGTLIDRHLIRIAGRKQVVGRPFMYATTREFLDRFGLKDLSELPKIEDMADALGFEPPMLQDTVTSAALPFEGEPPAEQP